MGDCSRIFVTIHQKDDDRFWELIEQPRPGRFGCINEGEHGQRSYEIENARCGWDKELRAAAEEGIRLYGEDLGCLGLWGPMVFATAGGVYSHSASSTDSSPVALVRPDGIVDENDVKSAKEYYATLKKVEEAIKNG